MGKPFALFVEDDRDVAALFWHVLNLVCDWGYENIDVILSDAKYAQALAIAQGDEYSKYYYQFSTKKKAA
jgi:hypothetical protein